MNAGPVAVCCLSSRELADPLGRLPGVAVAGPLMTANLGIEQLVRGLVQRPAVRTLLVCGRDSELFRAGQSLVSFFRHGVDPQCGIRSAQGYLPVLRTLSAAEIEAVRARVELVDARGERDPETLRRLVADCVGAGPPAVRGRSPAVTEPCFERLRPGGRRRRLSESLGGFVVINVDRATRRINLRHYDADLTPRHEMWGTRAESMLHGLLGARVIEDPAHAGYLGGELMKAEIALRLGLDYEQDLPLRRGTGKEASTA